YAVDPAFAPIRDLGDLAPMERERIEAFFRVYKQLPAGADTVELAGWGDAGEARATVAAALARDLAEEPGSPSTRPSSRAGKRGTGGRAMLAARAFAQGPADHRYQQVQLFLVHGEVRGEAQRVLAAVDPVDPVHAEPLLG